MRCPACGSTAISEQPERTAQGYRRYRCGNCGKQFNERSVGLLNRVQYPSDVIALVVLWRLRYKLSLRDLAEVFLTRGFTFVLRTVTEITATLVRKWRFVRAIIGGIAWATGLMHGEPPWNEGPPAEAPDYVASIERRAPVRPKVTPRRAT